MDKIIEEGRLAYACGISQNNNPYGLHQLAERAAWAKGWREVLAERLRTRLLPAT